jgi:hypothetical protein
MRPLSAVLITIAIFGFFGWVYVVAIQVTHPDLLTVQLSHWTPWLRMDNFGMSSFVLSFFSLLGFFLFEFSFDKKKTH